jgi:hypothetical protein
MKYLKSFISLSMLGLTLLVILLFVLRFFGVEPRLAYETEIENIQVYGIPLVILLSLFLTVDKRNGTRRNLTWIIITPIFSYACIFLMSIVMLFSTQHWIDFTITYQNKKDPNRTIREQLIDLGAHGYAHQGRVVEVRPTLVFFEYCVPIDTNQLQKSEWRYVNREGDVKFP